MSAIQARRLTVVACIALAGVLAVVGAAADPAPGKDGAALIERYADEPDRVNVKSLAYHFCYTLWMAAVLALVGLVRGRGAWLANVAGVLAVLAISTMPGFVVADFVDSTLGAELGTDRGFELSEKVGEFWALPVMAAPGALGLFLSLPLVAVAAWRGALLSHVAPVVALVGVLAFAVGGQSVVGNAVMAAAFVAFAVLVARIPFGTWLERPAATNAFD